MSEHRKIQVTKNYDMFEMDDSNRTIELAKHKNLIDSMKLYGYLLSLPIVVVKGSRGKWIVKDGQHRLAAARFLKLPVAWVEETTDFDIAVINSTAKTWVPKDYAEMYARNGYRSYEEGINFSARHHIPLGMSFALLAGKCSFSQVKQAFQTGEFKIKNRPLAESVASIFGPMVGMCKQLNKESFVTACMVVCSVPEFDAKRLLSNADKCRDKLVGFSNADAFLGMLEEVYNFGRKQIFPLKIESIKVLRSLKEKKASEKPKERIANDNPPQAAAG